MLEEEKKRKEANKIIILVFLLSRAVSLFEYAILKAYSNKKTILQV